MNDDKLNITEETNNGIFRLIAQGRIDSNNADLLLSKLESAIENGQKAIILNMSQINYLSSIGIRVILKIFSQVKDEGGSFNIEKPSEIVQKVLGMIAVKEMLIIN